MKDNFKFEALQMLSSIIEEECRQLGSRHQISRHQNFKCIYDYEDKIPCTGKMRNAEITYFDDEKSYCRVQKCTIQQREHQQRLIAGIINKKILQIPTYVFCQIPPNERIIQLPQDVTPLEQYINTHTLDLSAKLQLMRQISFFLFTLHEKRIGMFLKLSNICVTASNRILVYNLSNAYNLHHWAADFGQQKEQTIVCQASERDFPHIFYSQKELQYDRCDVYALGTILYRILVGRYPFNVGAVKSLADKSGPEFWAGLWTMQVESFEGGVVGKLLTYLILQCLELKDLSKRPYVEWLPAIFAYTRNNLFSQQ